jgi:hypothetical protein
VGQRQRDEHHELRRSPASPGRADPVDRGTNWIATATSRVGIAHNNWLIYGKAGVAWAN